MNWVVAWRKSVVARVLLRYFGVSLSYFPGSTPEPCRLQASIRRFKLAFMRNKWASCLLQGNLNFNVELVALDRAVGDYVIVHELLHFRAPNHGKLWKSLMRVHLTGYEEVKAKLPVREQPVSLMRG